jgi:ATP-binding cassette subfamily B protein
LKGNGGLYTGAVVMAALATLTSMLPPLVIKFTIDSVLNGQPIAAPPFITGLIDRFGGLSLISRNIWLCSLAIILIQAANGVCSYYRGRWTAIGSENIAKSLKDKLYNHLQRLPYNYHVNAQTGDLIQRCTSDVDTIRRFVANQLVELFRIVFTIVFSLIIMSGMNGFLTGMSVVLMPFVFIFSFVYFKRITQAFRRSDEKEGELQTVLQENLSGVRVVRAFGRERYEIDKFEEKNAAFRKLGIDLNRQMSYFWGISDGLCMTQVALVLFLGVAFTINGQLSLGALIVFNSYAGGLIYPIRGLARILSDMGRMGVSIGRVNEIISTPVESDTEGAAPYPLNGDIVFSHVSFEYVPGKPVLSDLSFTIHPGETIALLGGTGSGKSTIMHLLLRLYDYSNGSITINGRELRLIDKRYLRERVGMVLQEPFLYSKTIMENIRMARFDAINEEIYDASRTASVHDVIENFENGYDTQVGERGVTLSGGQKQRVAIARTLIKNSDILIFDDSLSAVDTETDAQIRAALRERQAGVTTFIISQRITTLMEADRIFVLEDGRLTDSGTHEELIGREGLYSRIWNIQNLLEDDFSQESGEEAISE